jgi:hypothetical protein
LKTKGAIAALPDPWACKACSTKERSQTPIKGADKAAEERILKKKKPKRALTAYNLYTRAQVWVSMISLSLEVQFCRRQQV